MGCFHPLITLQSTTPDNNRVRLYWLWKGRHQPIKVIASVELFLFFLFAFWCLDVGPRDLEKITWARRCYLVNGYFSSCYAVKFFRTPKVEFYGFLLNMFISEPLKIETNLYRYNFVHEQKDKIPKLFGSYPSSSKIKAWEFSTIPIRNVSNYIWCFSHSARW